MPEPTHCAWCAARLTNAIDAPGGLRCPACSVTTTSPWPSEGDLDAAYAGAYRPDAGRFAGPGDAILRRSRGRLAQRLDAISPSGAILDVGAGDGTLLRAIAATGREAFGLERDARPGTGAVRAQDVTQLDPADQSFAAIVFWHSLEHLAGPGAALDHAARLLAPGGVLVVAVPNADSLQARTFGRRWLALDPPRHLVHIPAGALIGRLTQSGLTPERVSHWRGGQVMFGWLHGLVAAAGGGDLYDAIRKPQARMAPLSPAARAGTLALGAVLAPVAVAASALEVARRRGGSIYVEGRMPASGPKTTVVASR